MHLQDLEEEARKHVRSLEAAAEASALRALPADPLQDVIWAIAEQRRRIKEVAEAAAGNKGSAAVPVGRVGWQQQ